MTGPAIETEGLGRPLLPACCGKPVGCTMTDGCAYLRHPWKRAVVLGDPTAPCPKGWQSADGIPVRCGLHNGHDGDCVPR
jgi:hypothetical protein